MSNAFEVGKKLVEMCRAGDFMGAINSLYSPKIVSTEALAAPGMPARMEGIEAVRGKAEWWTKNHEVHSAEIDGPYPNGDRVVVIMKMDVTAKAGPMAGKRMQMNEACLYTVKDGKIVEEEFFYTMGE